MLGEIIIWGLRPVGLLTAVMMSIIMVPSWMSCGVDALSSTSSSSSSTLRQIPRVSVDEFDQHMHYYHQRQRRSDSTASPPSIFDCYETPVIIQGVLSPDECESVCDTMVAECQDVTVDVQRKRSNQKTDIYQCQLHQALDIMMQSKRGDATFSFCEGLLDGDGAALVDLRALLRERRERLFQRKDGRPDEDLFEFFPLEATPSDCVVLAGEGATSTLHRDPFEWTGTSLCLEGTKVWRFAEPPGAASNLLAEKLDTDDTDDTDFSEEEAYCSGVHTIDEALNAYRLASVAWGDDGITISAGWQSDSSFYSNSKRKKKSVPSARELYEIECNKSSAEKIKLIESIATDTNKLLCPTDIIASGVKLWGGVQQPGDLLVIPAWWWHQTYALEPSLAVASQRCGSERDTRRVIRHILETAGLSEGLSLLEDGSFLENKNPQDLVDDLFDYIAKNAR
jgi:hypothetical protein